MRLLPPVFPAVASSRVPPSRVPELMDDPSCDLELLGRALDGLSTVNRWFGGFAAIRRPIGRALSRRVAGELYLLDVGAGAGDLAAALARYLRGAGWRPRFCLTDNHGATLRIARARTAGEGEAETFVRLDALRLPFAADSFDIGFAATMLHHLETDAAVRFLCELDRVSRLGWIVADLRRGVPLRFGVGLLGLTLFSRNWPAREDGRTSARRAFTAAEIGDLLAAAGLRDVVVRAGPFRWIAVGGEFAGL